MKLITFVSILLLPTLACAAGKRRLTYDKVTQSSAVDGDSTGLIEACGTQPIVGFTYCRVQEGSAAGQSLWFIAPPSNCASKEACAFIKVWNSQGQLIWGESVPKGKTRLEVKWSTLLGRDTFEISGRGFWSWTMELHWTDNEKRERVSTSQGDIVLRTFRAGYVPLHEVEDDPNFVWVWSEGKQLYKVTTGLRAFTKRLP